MQKKSMGLIVSAIIIGGLLSPVNAAPQPTQDYIVVLKDGVSSTTSAKLFARFGVNPSKKFNKVLNGAVVKVNETQAAQLASDANVASVELDGLVQASETSKSWGLDRIDQPNLPLNGNFNFPASAGTGVSVYIVDTGISDVNGNFTGRLVQGCSAIGSTVCQTSQAIDDNGHGTHVAGTTAGTTYGIAKNATLIPVKVLDSTGSGAYSSVIAGLEWVVINHAANVPAVVNMSLGGPASSALDKAVSKVISDGVSVVVAAGNSNANACNYSPSRVPGAITVGATGNWSLNANGQNDAMATYSNSGSCVDIFAPGTYIVSDSNVSGPATMSGTSMASPHVAGVAALLLGKNNSLTPSGVASQISNSAVSRVVLPKNLQKTTTTKLLQSPTS